MLRNREQESRTQSMSGRQALPSDPLGCYLPILLAMLVLGFLAYAYLVLYLSLLSWPGGPNLLDKLLLGLRIPLGALFSWMVSGIIICLLLLLWFRLNSLGSRYARIAFAIPLGIIVIWWIAGLVGHLEGAEARPMFELILGTFFRVFLAMFGVSAERVMLLAPLLSVILLAIGILVLPTLWCRRSMIGPFVLPFRLLLGLWVLWCLALIWGMREWRVGVELFVSMATTLSLFMVGLRAASGSLFPLPGREHWGKALGFLRDWVLGYNFPGYVVVDELYEEDKVEMRVPGNRFRESGFGSGPGFIISGANHAVAVSSNTRFKGVKGPGVVFTGYADQVMQTVDLRPQLRAFPVEAITRDGIRINTSIFVPCKIYSRGKPRLGEHLPYSPTAGFKAIRSQEMRHENPGQTQDRMTNYRWEELPRLIATRILQDIISRYDFDELYGPYRPEGGPARKMIADELIGRLRGELEEIGIEVAGGGISDLQPADSEVYVKRAQNWKETWEYRIALQKSESQAEWFKMVERARMEAQADLILAIGRRLESSMTRTDLRPQAALTQFVKLLDELMRQHPTLEGVVPEKTVETLMELRSIIE